MTSKDKAKIDDKHISDFLFILKFNDSIFMLLSKVLRLHIECILR